MTIRKPWPLLLTSLSAASVALASAASSPVASPLYPVYWNVNGWGIFVPEGSAELPVRLYAFGILPQNLTQIGSGCTLAGCANCNHTRENPNIPGRAGRESSRESSPTARCSTAGCDSRAQHVRRQSHSTDSYRTVRRCLKPEICPRTWS